MTLVIIEVIVFGWVVAGFTWYRLDTFNAKTKILYILFGFVICYLITLLLCNIASIGVEFETAEIKKEMLNNLVWAFTPINSIILMPAIGKTLSAYNSNELEDEEAIKKIRNIFIIYIVVAIIEVLILKNAQLGTIQYLNKIKK
jgi:hypothetical protein